MKQLALIIVLALVSMGTWGDFSCPDGAAPVCIDKGDKICPGSSKCVDHNATCFDNYPCGISSGFVCESEYHDILTDYESVVGQHNELASENTDLREKRLAQKNCVLNAATLENAKKCAR